MIPATSRRCSSSKVRELVATQDLQGFLLSGGSTRLNEIPYERYYPVLERLNRDLPQMKIAIHSALMDARGRASDGSRRCRHGHDGRHRRPGHHPRGLSPRPPGRGFRATLAALCKTSMKVSPHIVVGLHYGRILGEQRALDIVSRHALHSLVLVVVMPFYAKPGTFAAPDTTRRRKDIHGGKEATRGSPGAARLRTAAGHAQRVTDAYAVMAGLDGIAFPADGALGVAHAIGRPFYQEHACCSINSTARGPFHPAYLRA